ncbi:MAG: hypothetical protein JXQ81_01480 [Desulfuromonadales bacterium]|nr:hypothetical protein [Desulfuromonadales bacterium]MBN2791156.1 hypothetical protein [Desulfuromonadales bacterium]
MKAVDIFKTCKICRSLWSSRDQFIADPEVTLVGYQANFVVLEKGLFLFNHSCQGTMAIDVQAFADLYQGPVFERRLQGSEDCAGHCLHHNDLQPCPAQCECAYVREIISLLQTASPQVCQVV